MPAPLLAVLGIILIGVGIWGLFSGKVVAGSRGLRSNFHTREDSPLLFYSFVFLYLAVGSFALSRMF